MQVLVTRPPREAQRWADDLAQRGVAAQALPLIEIAPAPQGEPLRDAWRQLARWRAVMFVSGNAVQGFLEAQPAPRGAWPAQGPRAWAPGPGTRDALLRAGVPPGLIDAPAQDAAQFDSESLWPRVAAQVRPGDRVLLVRGADDGGQARGRDWLARQIVAAGAQVHEVVAYIRRAPSWDALRRAAAARAAVDGSVWLFSSSEAIANLLALLPGQDWGAARALATHPRIAQAARDAGFAVVCESRPDLASIVASIESMR